MISIFFKIKLELGIINIKKVTRLSKNGIRLENRFSRNFEALKSNEYVIA